MKYIKSFNESKGNKKELNYSIIEFLIHNERKLNVMFDEYVIEKGDNQWEIVAKTKANHKGIKPQMDEVRFPMDDFFNWISAQHKSRGYLADVKLNLFREIFDNYDSKTEPNEFDSKIIDSRFNQFGSWKICLSMINYIRKITSKFDVNDIDDRCLEYFDELSGWKPGFMIGYELLGRSWRTLFKDDIYETWWLLCQINEAMSYSADLLTIVSSNVKPCIYIQFNIIDDADPYDYKDVQKIAVGLTNRLSQLYPISKVKYDNIHLSGPAYKDKKVPITRYNLILYIE